jgi:hypothetical protein
MPRSYDVAHVSIEQQRRFYEKAAAGYEERAREAERDAERWEHQGIDELAGAARARAAHLYDTAAVFRGAIASTSNPAPTAPPGELPEATEEQYAILWSVIRVEAVEICTSDVRHDQVAMQTRAKGAAEQLAETAPRNVAFRRILIERQIHVEQLALRRSGDETVDVHDWLVAVQKITLILFEENDYVAFGAAATAENPAGEDCDPFHLGKDHKPWMRVPKGSRETGGSLCVTCRFLTSDGKRCWSQGFKEYTGSDALPLPADEMCSDWYEPIPSLLKKR